jgi:hypothetical protein
MTDPLSISASIIAVLQLTSTVVQYLNDAKDASGDRQRLLGEVASASGLLYCLKDLGERAKWSQNWFLTVMSLNVPNGPLEQFQRALERIEVKLQPAGGLKKAGKVLIWPFQKGEIKEILQTIERQKTLFNLALQNDHVKLSQAIKDDVRGLHNAVKEIGTEVLEIGIGVSELRVSQDYQKSRMQDQESGDLAAFLSPLNFCTKQKDFFARRQEGTGNWLLENDKFKQWLDGTRRTLWCPGIPGAGKTILASVVIDFLERTFVRENVGVAYIYCNYKEPDQTAINLVGAIVRQLVQQRSELSEQITDLRRSHSTKQTRPSLDEYSRCLQSEISRFPKVFIVIDALDECIESNGTRRVLLDEFQKLQSHVHLLVTSRLIVSIEQDFADALRLEICASDEDIRRYLEGRIGKEDRLKRLIKADLILQNSLIDTIVENAKGM